MRASLLIALLLIAPASWAGDASVRTYTTQEAQRAQSVRVARVLMVREVQITSGKTAAGTTIGAAVGYGVARKSDHRSARVLGTVLGGAAGRAVQGAIHRRGLENYLQEPNGRTWAIVQEADVLVRPGDNVALVGSGRKLRVVPLGVN